MTLIEMIVSLFLVSGSLLIAFASIGLVKLPDLFCRAHALTKAMTLGITLMLIACWVAFGTDELGFKSAVAIFFQFTTIPVSAHILGKVAYAKNIERWKHKPILKIKSK